MALQTSDPSAAVITSVGTAHDGGTTTSTTPVITGTADAGDIVSIYDGVRLLGTALAAANGTWSFTPTVALKTGAHSFAAIAHDSNGNYGASSATVGVQIASSGPAAPPVITNIVDTIGKNAALVTIPTGGATSGNQPTLSGTGVIGDTVNIFQNGTACGSTVVDATGHWSLKIPAAMTDGTHVMTATQFASGQAQSATSNSWSITINTTTPATPTTPTMTDDSGNAIAGGSTSNDPHPHISGNGTAGDTITVYDNGTVIGSTTIGGDGKWSFTPSPDLPNGNNSIVVIETNPAGTPSSGSTPIVIVVDTTVPAAPVITSATDAVGPVQGAIPANGYTDDSHPTIAGTAKAGDIIKILNNGTVIGSTTADASGKWSFKPTAALPEGATVLTATDTNAAGTTSVKSASLSFTVDTLSGALPVITSATGTVGGVANTVLSGGITADTKPAINGTGHPGDIIKVYDGSTTYLWGSTTVGADGKWTMTPASVLNNATHNLFATATSGNATGAVSAHTAFFPIQIDTSIPATPAAPTFTDDSGHAIPAGSTTADAHPHINGTGTAGDIIKVYDNGAVIGSTTIGTDGKWSFTPTTDMTNGNNSITVIETNPAGTSSAASTPVVITVDTTTPATPAAPTMTDDLGTLIPAGSTSSDAHPHFSGTGTAGDTIKLYDGSTLIGSAVIGADGKWTIQPSVDLTNGSHDLSVTETNPAGTASASSPHVALIVATVAAPPPPVITDIMQQNSTGGNTPLPLDGNIPSIADHGLAFYGSGELGDIIKLYDKGVLIASVTVTSWGWGTGWNFGALTAGSHDVTFTQTNPLTGLTSLPTSHFTFSVAAAAIAAPVIVSMTETTAADANIALGSGGNMALTSGVTYTGTGITGDVVKLYDKGQLIGSVTVTAGTWSFSVAKGAVAAGTHDISAVQSDSAGGVSPYSNHATFSVGTGVPTAPVITTVMQLAVVGGNTVVSAGDNLSAGSGIAFYGTGVAGDVIKFYDHGALVATFTVNASGAWVAGYNYTSVPAGSHDVTITQTNPTTGLESLPTAHFMFTADLTVPPTPAAPVMTNDLNAVIAPGSSTTDAHPHFIGTGRQGDVFKLYDGNTMIGSAVAGADGTWIITPAVDLTTGQHALHVTDTNPGGATSTSSPIVYVTIAAGVSGTLKIGTVDSTDDTAHAASGVDASQADHHTVVGSHDAFIGTAANGNETVDLNVDPASYFKETTAHIQGSGGTAIDTLHLMGDHQVLDLTSLTGQTAAAKISGIEVIDLGGHSNNLKLSLTDVLNLGEQDLFQKDGHQQLMVKGSDGDTVDLSNAHIAGVADGQWQAEGTAVVGGVTYNVYEHSGAHTELLVQQGVQIALHN